VIYDINASKSQVADKTRPNSMNTPTPSEPQSKQHNWPRCALRLLVFMALGWVLLLLTVWARAALYFDVRVSWPRAPLAVAYVVAVLAVWVLVKGTWLKMGLTAGGFALVLAWWFTLQPSNDRAMIATNLPLAELKQRAHVNARARAADKQADFCLLIRQGVPGTWTPGPPDSRTKL